MIIEDNRELLDDALTNESNRILLLSGGPKSAFVHTWTEGDGAGSLAPWEECYLIEDLGLLADEEKAQWFGGENAERYAVLKGSEMPKEVIRVGSVDDLMLSETEVDPIAISTAYAGGD